MILKIVIIAYVAMWCWHFYEVKHAKELDNNDENF